MTERIAFIGAGKMAEALIAGLIRSGTSRDVIEATARRDERAAELTERYGIHVTTNQAAAQWADLVVIGVKPADVVGVLDDIADSLKPGTVVVSIAAAVSCALMEAHLPDGTAVVRAMPNTPAFVGEGITVLSAGTHATKEHLADAEAVFEAVGMVRVLPEAKQNAVAALSGSGPAYFYYLVEAMSQAAVMLGLTHDLALELAVQTAVGASVLMKESGEHPVVLRENVMSPGGTTVAAMRELEAHGVRAAIFAALEAGRDRSEAMAAEAR